MPPRAVFWPNPWAIDTGLAVLSSSTDSMSVALVVVYAPGVFPMSTDGSFDQLMVRLRAGDPDAASVIFHGFVRRLIGLARTKLDAALQNKVDAEDVAQSVFKSFLSASRRDNSSCTAGMIYGRC